jgi:membrane protease YdiL (CAAX protease family)
MDAITPVVVPMKTDLRLAGVFALAGALAVAAIFPYLMVVMPELMAKVPASIPLPLLIAAQMLQAGLLLGLLAFAGLRMGHHVGLGAPWLTAWLMDAPRPRVAWLLAIGLGLLSGIAIVGLDPFFMSQMPAALHALPAPEASTSAGTGFLASFYGGIGEELQLRLFLMTGVVFGLWLLARRRSAPWMFWLAIVIAALLFGAGHLPAAAQMWPLDSVVIARTLLLNGLGGFVFGWLYWRRGIEAAMIAHFSADLVLHVFAPLISG